MSIELLRSRAEFGVAKRLVERLLVPQARLPDYVFRSQGGVHAFIDSDAVFQRVFFDQLVKFLRAKGDRVVIMQVTPDPESYFFVNFGKYPSFWVSGCDDPGECLRILGRNPGGSPADAIAVRSEVVAMCPDGGRWVIHVDRMLELGVAKFESGAVASEFFEAVPHVRRFEVGEVPQLLAPVFANRRGGVPKGLREGLVANY